MIRIRSQRAIARLLLAVLLFAQASVAFADCAADRGQLAKALASADMELCHSPQTFVSDFGPLNPNRCVAHCTSDLQIAAATVAIVRSAASVPVLFVPRSAPVAMPATGLLASPPGAPPPRILQHAFLI
jgi:hypothetical protein